MSITTDSISYVDNKRFASLSSYDYRDFMDRDVALFAERTLSSLIGSYDEMPATADASEETPRSAWLFEVIEASTPAPAKNFFGFKK